MTSEEPPSARAAKGAETGAGETLERLLAKVRLDAAFYFSVSAGAPWATLTPHMRNIGSLVMPNAQRILPFHLMLEGEAWCWRSDAPTQKRRFAAGDVLLLPRGCDHVIASGQAPDDLPEPDVEIYREAEKSGRPCTYVDLGGGGPKANFVCGYFGAPRQRFNPLFDALPDLLILTPEPEKWRMLRQLVVIATEQQRDRRSGGRLVASRLAETMFVDAVQAHLLDQSQLDGGGWPAALCDDHVGPALRALHAAPTKRWTVDMLARAAGLSRSAFAERFHALTGTPPLRYAQLWRLQIAANALAQTDRAIKEISEECGYGSETAFHRAFRRRMGVTPGAWRALHASEADSA